MRIGLAFEHSQCGVHQQDSLFGPLLQRTTRADRRSLQRAFNFFLDVLQAGWGSNARRYRERESFSLARPVVRVLAQDDHFRVLHVEEGEAAQHLIRGRKERESVQVLEDFVEVVFVEFFGKRLFPSVQGLSGDCADVAVWSLANWHFFGD